MYGSRREFEGRITGFTMGTGQTLSLLPPQNATGNFVKIVQRLPVRIELTDYDPDKAPLFVGLSVDPLRVLQGAAHGAARRRGPATASPAPAGPHRAVPGEPSQSAAPLTWPRGPEDEGSAGVISDRPSPRSSRGALS